MPNRRKNKKKSIKVVIGNASKKGKSKRQKSSKRTVIGSLLRAGGSMLGGYLGGPQGAMIGQQAGGFISRITGQGAYTVKNNSLMAGNVFTFSKETDGELTLCRQEYVGSVYSSGDFTIQTFDINPGLSSFLPWGSGIAKLYEQYQLDGCVFEYRSTSGNVSTVQALGDVYFATEYDPTRAVYANKQEMLTSLNSQQCKPSESLLHPVECARRVDAFGNHRYIRTGDVTTDKRFNDIGRFSVATEGMPSDGEQVGELWATVKVRLYKPLYASALTGNTIQYITGTAGTRDSSWFSAYDTEGASLVVASANTFVFLSPGEYSLSVWVQINSATAVNQSLAKANWTGTATTSLWGTDLLDLHAPGTLVSAAFMMVNLKVTVSAASQTAIMPSGLWGGGTWQASRAVVIKYAEYAAPAASSLKIKTLRSKEQLDRELQQLMIEHFKQKLSLKFQSETEDEYENLSSVSGSAPPALISLNSFSRVKQRGLVRQ